MGGSRAEPRGRGQQLWPLPPAAESVAVMVPRAPLPVPHSPGWAHLGHPGEQIPKSDSEVVLRRGNNGVSMGAEEQGARHKQGWGRRKGRDREKEWAGERAGAAQGWGSEGLKAQSRDRVKGRSRQWLWPGQNLAGVWKGQGRGSTRARAGAGKQMGQGWLPYSSSGRDWVPCPGS